MVFGKILSPGNLLTCAIAIIACWQALTSEPGRKSEGPGQNLKERNGVQPRYFIPTKSVSGLVCAVVSRLMWVQCPCTSLGCWDDEDDHDSDFVFKQSESLGPCTVVILLS